jgi:hypothetical protein
VRIRHPDEDAGPQAKGRHRPKDNVHVSNDRVSTQLTNTHGSILPAQPATTPREPMVSGLSREEIRRIVLDLIG